MALEIQLFVKKGLYDLLHAKHKHQLKLQVLEVNFIREGLDVVHSETNQQVEGDDTLNY